MACRLLIALAASTSALGCSLFTPLGDFASEDPPGAPDGDADAGAGSRTEAGFDAAAPGQDAGPNLHGDGTFESGCAPWESYRGTTSISDRAHEGAQSCQFCASTNGDYSADDKGFLRNPPPGTYRAEGWVRAAPGTPAPMDGVFTFLRTINTAGGFTEVEKSEGDMTRLGDEWIKVDATLRVTQPAEALNVVVGGAGGGTCFLLDDVRAFRLD